MTHDELVALLKIRVKEAGGLVKFAEKHGMDRSYVDKVIYCGEKPGPKIAMALGLRKVVTFEPIPTPSPLAGKK